MPGMSAVARNSACNALHNSVPLQYAALIVLSSPLGHARPLWWSRRRGPPRERGLLAQRCRFTTVPASCPRRSEFPSTSR